MLNTTGKITKKSKEGKNNARKKKCFEWISRVAVQKAARPEEKVS